MENDLLEIADDTDRDYREGKNGQEIPNKEVVLRSKIRIESRQWLMSRRDPKQWGNKSSVDVSANIMMLSPEERVQKALQLFDSWRSLWSAPGSRRCPISRSSTIPSGDLPLLPVRIGDGGIGEN